MQKKSVSRNIYWFLFLLVKLLLYLYYNIIANERLMNEVYSIVNEVRSKIDFTEELPR